MNIGFLTDGAKIENVVLRAATEYLEESSVSFALQIGVIIESCYPADCQRDLGARSLLSLHIFQEDWRR